MLLQFSVRNFRSIRDWVTFSMIPLERLDKHDGKISNKFEIDSSPDIKALKVGVVYGKNASGKSNLLLAIRAMAYLVNSASKYEEFQNIPPHEPYLFEKDSADMPCDMEVDFVAKNSLRYNYTISYNKHVILEEKLTFYPKKQPAILFSRSFDTITQTHNIDFGPQFKGDKRYVKEKNLSNKLLLSEFKGSEYVNTKDAYDFFKGIIVNSTRSNRGSADTHDVLNISTITRTLGRLKAESQKQYELLVKRIVTILKSADTGIEGLEVIKVESIGEESDFEKERYQVFTFHNAFIKGEKAEPKRLSIFDESTGTIKLFGLINSVINGLTNGSLLCLDELDRSFHPKITRLIIQLFHAFGTRGQNLPNSCPQLIFTTHDSSLLDNGLFRRDQIWFTDTDAFSSTTLYCLAEIKGVRKDTPYSEWYLSGRFGATPVTNEFEVEV